MNCFFESRKNAREQKSICQSLSSFPAILGLVCCAGVGLTAVAQDTGELNLPAAVPASTGLVGALRSSVGLGVGSDTRPYELDLVQNDPLQSLVFSSYFLARGGIDVPLEFSSFTLVPQIHFELRKLWKPQISMLNKTQSTQQKGFGFAASPGLLLSGNSEPARWHLGLIYQYDRMNYNDALSHSSWQGLKLESGLNVGPDPQEDTSGAPQSIFPVGHLKVGWIPSLARYNVSRDSGVGKTHSEQGKYSGFDFEFGLGVGFKEPLAWVPDRLEISYGRGEATYHDLHVSNFGLPKNVRSSSESFVMSASYYFEPDFDFDFADSETVPQ